MQRKDINRYLDAQGLPDANQRYVIPESFSSSTCSFHNRGLYSLWNHFVEYCVHNSRLVEERRRIENDNFFQVSNYLGNRHIFGTYRLKIFVHLSMVVETSGQRRMYSAFAAPTETGFGILATPRERCQYMGGAYGAPSEDTFLPGPGLPVALSHDTLDDSFATLGPPSRTRTPQLPLSTPVPSYRTPSGMFSPEARGTSPYPYTRSVPLLGSPPIGGSLRKSSVAQELFPLTPPPLKLAQSPRSLSYGDKKDRSVLSSSAMEFVPGRPSGGAVAEESYFPPPVSTAPATELSDTEGFFGRSLLLSPRAASKSVAWADDAELAPLERWEGGLEEGFGDLESHTSSLSDGSAEPLVAPVTGALEEGGSGWDRLDAAGGGEEEEGAEWDPADHHLAAFGFLGRPSPISIPVIDDHLAAAVTAGCGGDDDEAWLLQQTVQPPMFSPTSFSKQSLSTAGADLSLLGDGGATNAVQGDGAFWYTQQPAVSVSPTLSSSEGAFLDDAGMHVHQVSAAAREATEELAAQLNSLLGSAAKASLTDLVEKEADVDKAEADCHSPEGCLTIRTDKEQHEPTSALEAVMQRRGRGFAGHGSGTPGRRSRQQQQEQNAAVRRSWPHASHEQRLYSAAGAVRRAAAAGPGKGTGGSRGKGDRSGKQP